MASKLRSLAPQSPPRHVHVHPVLLLDRAPSETATKALRIEVRVHFLTSTFNVEGQLLFLTFSCPCVIDNLLSTAILATPKSSLGSSFKSGVNLDQSLHHIDACIKSPLDFGSPTAQ
jgi:hypothetical protein